jgi:DNA polymerase epsilon subunit 4
MLILNSKELFIQYISEQGHKVAQTESKPRRNIQYRDLGKSRIRSSQSFVLTWPFVATAVSRVDNLQFLSDVVPRTVPFKEVKARTKEGASSTSSAKASSTLQDGKIVKRSSPPANGIRVSPWVAARASGGETLAEPADNDLESGSINQHSSIADPMSVDAVNLPDSSSSHQHTRKDPTEQVDVEMDI